MSGRQRTIAHVEGGSEAGTSPARLPRPTPGMKARAMPGSPGRARRRARLAALLLVPAGVGACGGGGAGSTPAAAPAGPPLLHFAEAAKRPLGYLDHGVVSRRGAIEVRDVSYLSRGRRVAGYLVERSGAGRRPGVVLVHGSGGDRSELLGDAVALASRGVVALTITEPSSASPPPPPTSNAELLAQSRLTVVEDVVAVRRAADVLQALPSVNPQRIGYLGWSAGAKTGAFVAASDRRFGALVLLSGGADTLSQFVAAAPRALRPSVRRVLGSVDPLRYLALARPGTLLLEDGTRDSVVPRPALENFARAAPRDTVVRWYAADHPLNEAAFRAAFAWLVRKLH